MIRRDGEGGSKAASTLVGYIINMGMGVVAISILLFSLQGVFEDVTSNAAETEMEIVGEKVANEIEKVDRVAQVGGSAEGSIVLPEFESRYEVTVNYEGGQGYINLTKGETNVGVKYSNTTPVEGASNGIDVSSSRVLKVEYNESDDVIRVRGG